MKTLELKAEDGRLLPAAGASFPAPEGVTAVRIRGRKGLESELEVYIGGPAFVRAGCAHVGSREITMPTPPIGAVVIVDFDDEVVFVHANGTS